MPSFGSNLAGSWAPRIGEALVDYQFYNPVMPQEGQQLGSLFGSLINKGSMSFGDETGTVGLNPTTGQLEVMGKNFGIGLNANQFNPSAELKFQFGKQNPMMPRMMDEFLQQGIEAPGMSPARQELEQNLEQYKTNNPYWYRP